MKNQLVFQEKSEVQRLGVQHRLLQRYETDIFAHVLSGKRGLAVLDVGSNNGAKTSSSFTHAAISSVIGLEYHEKLAMEAQKKYGGDVFSFHALDVEASGFAERLAELAAQRDVHGFDLIHLSLILMHLDDPGKLLLDLKPFLKPDGKMIIIEANDAVSALSPDPEGLLKEFLGILSKDRYAGNRSVGGRLEALLTECGYEDIHIWHEGVEAGSGEEPKKRSIWTTFFSYLPEDVALLRRLEPDDAKYRAWAEWLEANHHRLNQLVMQPESSIFMGMKMLTCRRGE